MKIEDLCLPLAIDSSVDLPPDEGFDLTKNVHFYSSELLDTAQTGHFIEANTLTGYEEYAKLLEKPVITGSKSWSMSWANGHQMSIWTADFEWGQSSCYSLMQIKFPVTNEMLRSSLQGLILENEMKVRK